MRRCTLEEVARFSGGRLVHGDPALPIDRLHTDTRTLAKGDCFVALRGDRFDGHSFLPNAHRHGAVAALVAPGHTGDSPDNLAIVEVPNTLEGLQRFAANYRQLLSVRTIGVTGSSGKTSTKEMIASVLRTKFKTKATQGNLNNHIGVPLTLIGLDEDDEFAVVEMGMNHPGELAPLVRMTAPTIGVISSIGPAHIEFFPDQAGIAAEKAELIAALPPEGLAVLNANDEWSRRVVQRTHARVVWTGNSPDSTWHSEDLHISADGLSFQLVHDRVRVPVTLPVLNSVMIGNALLAAAVGHECGLSLEEIAHGLKDLRLPGGRMSVVKVHGASLINDAYNANPDSIRAALVALREFPGAQRRGAVLGSMGELGAHAADLHRAIGEFAATQELAYLIAVGPYAEAYATGALAGGMPLARIISALDAEEATTALRPLMRTGDAILIKGSRFMGLERVVMELAGAAEGKAH